MMKLGMVCLPYAQEAREPLAEEANRLAGELVESGHKLTGVEFNASQEEMNGVVYAEAKYLAKALDALSYCDAAAFCDGWEDDVCTRVLHEVAEAAGRHIEIVEKSQNGSEGV